jgi:outer membrane protein OmpA-like peptidoglycan-associated protein
MGRTEGRVQQPVLLSIHGIRTTGRWQKSLTQAAQEAGYLYRPLDYGYFLALSLLLPWARRRKVEWFHRECEDHLRDLAPGQRASIVAHSFGTYLLASALAKYSDLVFDKVILCGSIVRKDYPWTSVIERRGQVRQVLNEAGGKDLWASIVTWVVADAGSSGVDGFEDLAEGKVLQRLHAEHGHSDYFYAGNYKRVWIPFLQSGRIDPVEPIAAPRTNWRFAAVAAIVLSATLGGPAWWWKSRSADGPVHGPEVAPTNGAETEPTRACAAFDDDGDGVDNCKDQCGDDLVPGPVGPDGCASLEPWAVTILFDYDRSSLGPESVAKLDAAVEALEQHDWLRYEVAGHTGRSGGQAYNVALSMRRATTVHDFLLGRGVDRDRLDGPNGYGETRPVGQLFHPDGTPDMDMVRRSERVDLVPLRR